MLTAAPRPSYPARHRQAGSAETRKRILAAALSTFTEDGYKNTTMRAIAGKAGITDAAIYYHFPAKEELFRELIGTDLSLHRNSHHHPRTGSISEAMLSLVGETIELLQNDGRLLTLILREALAGNPIALRRYCSILRSWETHAAGQLRPFETTGHLEPGEAAQVSRQVIYVVIMSFEDMLLLSPDLTLRPLQRPQHVHQFITRAIESLASGLAKRPGSVRHCPTPRPSPWLPKN